METDRLQFTRNGTLIEKEGKALFWSNQTYDVYELNDSELKELLALETQQEKPCKVIQKLIDNYNKRKDKKQ